MARVQQSTFIHPALTLISHPLCPYVQRAVIALEEKGLPYKRKDIDLNNKPEWFTELSPLGKVPVLVIENDTVLFESAAIAEYVNDISGSQLLNGTPVERARERAWIEFSSATLNNIGQLYSAKDEFSFHEVSNQLDVKWALLERNISQSKFFTGESFSLVDAAFAPVFRYFDVLESFAEFGGLRRQSNVARWRKTLSKRYSVINAVSADYPELLIQFIKKRDSYLAMLVRTCSVDTTDSFAFYPE